MSFSINLYRLTVGLGTGIGHPWVAAWWGGPEDAVLMDISMSLANWLCAVSPSVL